MRISYWYYIINNHVFTYLNKYLCVFVIQIYTISKCTYREYWTRPHDYKFIHMHVKYFTNRSLCNWGNYIFYEFLSLTIGMNHRKDIHDCPVFCSWSTNTPSPPLIFDFWFFVFFNSSPWGMGSKSTGR